jgi:hypothetical protein
MKARDTEPISAEHVTPIEQWHRELREGRRTVAVFDELWAAACREQADREFTAHVQSQREYVARLQGRTPEQKDETRRAPPLRSPRRFVIREGLR